MIQLTNAHQSPAILFHFGFPIPLKHKKGNISFKLNHIGSDVHETQNILKFLQVLVNANKLRLTFLQYDNAILEMDVPPFLRDTIDSELLEVVRDPEYFDLIDKLCFIQSRTDRSIKIPDDGITPDQIRIIHTLFQILKKGSVVKEYPKATIELGDFYYDKILEVHQKGVPTSLQVALPDKNTYLFNQEISLGFTIRWIMGVPITSITELEKQKMEDSVIIELKDVEFVDIYPQWFVREAERLSQLLVENFDIEAIYPLGSLAWGDTWRPTTDIDLAVKGLPGTQLFQALSFLERETEVKFDLD